MVLKLNLTNEFNFIFNMKPYTNFGTFSKEKLFGHIQAKIKPLSRKKKSADNPKSSQFLIKTN